MLVKKAIRKHGSWAVVALAGIIFILFFLFPEFFGKTLSYSSRLTETEKGSASQENKFVLPSIPPLDKEAYDRKLAELANNPPPAIVYETVTETDESGKTVTKRVPLNPQPEPPETPWPVKTAYPNAGAILPFQRIIAYYGNLYSTKMGVLGEYPEAEMLSRLQAEVKKWQEADPETPVLPALHYIAVVAQGSPGADGKYRARMPGTEIEKVLAIAERAGAIVFLDVQVGFSTIEAELPLLEKYLKLPNVHLGMDPEFSMKGTHRPGKVVGTYDAKDINFAAEYLAGVVRENNLTPKVLVVHRYTQNMVTNYQNIKPLPEVQIVMHMDGWGVKAKKIGTYKNFIYPEPVQFTGFKLFYKNDLWEPGTTLFTPEELLELRPKPVYIQYQ